MTTTELISEPTTSPEASTSRPGTRGKFGNRLARWATVAVTFSAVATGVGMTTVSPAAAVGGYSIRSGSWAVRSGPTTGSGQYGTARAQNVADLTCQYWGAADGAQAVSVSGFGTSAIWDRVNIRLTDGRQVVGVMSDLGIYETRYGQQTPGIPRCRDLDASVPTSRADAAVNWYAARNGSTAFENRCEVAAENAYGTQYRYANPNAAWSDAVARGLAHTSGTPPRGALVFWNQAAPNGHIGVSDGSGYFWATSVNGRIGRAQLPNYPAYSNYRGWVPAGALF